MDGAMVGLSAGADLLGGYMAYKGQSAANETNYQIALENRRFQKSMSDTAYSRAARDLKRAGLNRILALGGPLSTPSGSTATMVNPSQQTPAVMSAAAGRLRMAEEVKLLREQQANVQSSTNLNNANAVKAAADAAQAEVMKEFFEVLRPHVKDLGQWLGEKINSAKEPGVMDSWNRGIEVIMEKLDEAWSNTKSSAKQQADEILNLKPLQLVPDSKKKQLREQLEGLDYYEKQRLFREYFDR